jgi:hypothetical protein
MQIDVATAMPIRLKPPDAAFNLALQEQKYYDLVERCEMCCRCPRMMRTADVAATLPRRLNAMLTSYHGVISRLSDVERVLMSARIKDLKEELGPGLKVLNWNSLAIPEFVSKCEKALQAFDAKVENVQKYAKLIRKAVRGIRSTELLDAVEFFCAC